MNTTWNDNHYVFAMNGQTGKFVGDLPLDKGAAVRWLLGLGVALSAVSYGVILLLQMAGLI